MAGRIEISEAVKSYKTNNPSLEEQTFEGLVEHIIQQAPNMTVAAAGYAGAAISAKDINDMVEAAVKKATKEAYDRGYAAASDAAGSSKSDKINGNNKKFFCYLHGKNSTHNGDRCRVMANDTTFTAAQKTAKKHN